MSKGELRRKRKAARAAGKPLEGELALSDKDKGPVEWTDSPGGQRARERWARAYDELNGAPENDDDR